MTDTATAAEQRIPVTVLTGFLGSGKTTLLNKLLRRPELADTAVIINEFGEIGLDHLLVEKSDDEGMVTLNSGCLCCTVRGDLVRTMSELFQPVGATDDLAVARLEHAAAELFEAKRRGFRRCGR